MDEHDKLLCRVCPVLRQPELIEVRQNLRVLLARVLRHGATTLQLRKFVLWFLRAVVSAATKGGFAPCYPLRLLLDELQTLGTSWHDLGRYIQALVVDGVLYQTALSTYGPLIGVTAAGVRILGELQGPNPAAKLRRLQQHWHPAVGDVELDSWERQPCHPPVVGTAADNMQHLYALMNKLTQHDGLRDWAFVTLQLLEQYKEAWYVSASQIELYVRSLGPMAYRLCCGTGGAAQQRQHLCNLLQCLAQPADEVPNPAPWVLFLIPASDDGLLQLAEQLVAVQQCSGDGDSADVLASGLEQLPHAVQQQCATSAGSLTGQSQDQLQYVQQLVHHGCSGGIKEVEPAMDTLQDVLADWKPNREFEDIGKVTCSWFGPKAVGAAAPDDHWDVALKGVPGVTSADCQRTGQGWMPTEQEAAHYTLQSLGDHLERRNVLLGRLRWGNFGQTAPTVEADLMLTGKMEPFRVRFHLYVPQDVDDLVVRTRMEMKQMRDCGPKLWLVLQFLQLQLKLAASWYKLHMGHLAAVSRALLHVLLVWDKQPGQQGVWSSAAHNSASDSPEAAGPADPADNITPNEISSHLQYLARRLQQPGVTMQEVWHLAAAVAAYISTPGVKCIHIDLSTGVLELNKTAGSLVGVAGMFSTHTATEQAEKTLDSVTLTAMQRVLQHTAEQMMSADLNSRMAENRAAVSQVTSVLQPRSLLGSSNQTQEHASAGSSDLFRRQHAAAADIILQRSVPAVLTALVQPSQVLDQEQQAQQRTACASIWGVSVTDLADASLKMVSEAKSAATAKEYGLAGQLSQAAVLEMAEAVAVAERAGPAALNAILGSVKLVSSSICEVRQLLDTHVHEAQGSEADRLRIYEAYKSDCNNHSLQAAQQRLDVARAQQEQVDAALQESEHLFEWAETAVVAVSGDLLAVIEAAVAAAGTDSEEQEMMIFNSLPAQQQSEYDTEQDLDVVLSSPEPVNKKRRLA